MHTKACTHTHAHAHPVWAPEKAGVLYFNLMFVGFVPGIQLTLSVIGAKLCSTIQINHIHVFFPSQYASGLVSGMAVLQVTWLYTFLCMCLTEHMSAFPQCCTEEWNWGICYSDSVDSMRVLGRDNQQMLREPRRWWRHPEAPMKQWGTP